MQQNIIVKNSMIQNVIKNNFVEKSFLVFLFLLISSCAITPNNEGKQKLDLLLTNFFSDVKNYGSGCIIHFTASLDSHLPSITINHVAHFLKNIPNSSVSLFYTQENIELADKLSEVYKNYEIDVKKENNVISSCDNAQMPLLIVKDNNSTDNESGYSSNLLISLINNNIISTEPKNNKAVYQEQNEHLDSDSAFEYSDKTFENLDKRLGNKNE